MPLIDAPRATTAARPTRRLRLAPWALRNSRQIVVFIGLSAAFAAWLRLPAVARDTLWAEDGRNFLQDAMRYGPIDSLVIPYAGYLHTVPRLIAAATVQFAPVVDYAQWMTALSCLAAGVIAAVVYVTSVDIVRSAPLRLLLSGITVLAPLAPREVLGNAANLHSLMFWGLFWMLLYRPRSRRGSVALGILALFGALTEIQSVFLLPVMLWRPRDRRRWPLRLGYLIGTLAQIIVTLVWPRSPNTTAPAGIASTLYGYLINAVMPIWLPPSAIGPALLAGGAALGIALLVPFAAAAVVAVVRGSRAQRLAVIGLAVGSVLIYSVSIALNPAPFYDYSTMSAHDLGTPWLVRYGVVPSMMLLAIPLVALATVRRRTGGCAAPPQIAVRPAEPRPVPSPLIVSIAGRFTVGGLVLLLMLTQFVPQNTRRSGGPAWQPQMAAAQRYCQTQPERAVVRFSETINWHVDVACWRL